MKKGIFIFWFEALIVTIFSWWQLTCWFPPVGKRSVPTTRHGGALSPLNSDCEAHRSRKSKRYKADWRAYVFTYDGRSNLFVDLDYQKWWAKIISTNWYFGGLFWSNIRKSLGNQIFFNVHKSSKLKPEMTVIKCWSKKYYELWSRTCLSVGILGVKAKKVKNSIFILLIFAYYEWFFKIRKAAWT